MLTTSRRDQRELFERDNGWTDIDHREGHGGGQLRLVQQGLSALALKLWVAPFLKISTPVASDSLDFSRVRPIMASLDFMITLASRTHSQTFVPTLLSCDTVRSAGSALEKSQSLQMRVPFETRARVPVPVVPDRQEANFLASTTCYRTHNN